MSKAKKSGASKGASNIKTKYSEFFVLECTRHKDFLNTQRGKNSESSNPDENPTYAFKSVGEITKQGDGLRKFWGLQSEAVDKDDPVLKKMKITKQIEKQPIEYASLAPAGMECINLILEEVTGEYGRLSPETKNTNVENIPTVVKDLIDKNKTADPGRGSIIACILTIAKAASERGTQISLSNAVSPTVITALNGGGYHLEDEIARSFALCMKLVAIDAVADRYPLRATINQDSIASMLYRYTPYNFPQNGIIWVLFDAEYGTKKENDSGSNNKTEAKKPPAAATTNDYDDY